MNSVARRIGVAAGVISFLLCLGAGLWIVTAGGFESGDDAGGTGIGLYFVGKAFFVGPMLIITCLSIGNS